MSAYEDELDAHPEYLDQMFDELRQRGDVMEKTAKPEPERGAATTVPRLVRDMVNAVSSLTEKATILHAWSLTLPADLSPAAEKEGVADALQD